MTVKIKLLLMIAVLLSPVVVNAQNADDGAAEVNLLIDVSGSMKQNDPKNQRISAARLIINLLPDGAKAGIWLFAEQTQAAIKTGTVNKTWKKKALAAANKIHSRGMLTDIEKAIKTVLSDGAGRGRKKSLILLTDGMVDISQDIMVSADSRERILSELIPVLQERRIEVDTIALSENADKELLDRLAFDTNGWTEMPDSADQLQKAFLKMFNKAVPRDSVPLDKNSFTIDDHVEEFSALVFKKQPSSATKLISPSGKALSHSKPEGAGWVQDSHYDLITVQKPETGVWKIDADIDPDNQVMVVTDLKLQIDELPKHIAEKETLEVKAWLSEKGKAIERDDFLSLVTMSLQQTDALQRKSEWPMQQTANGMFSQTIGETLEKGRHRLKIVVDGKTFQREFDIDIDVVESAISVSRSLDSGQKQVVLTLTPNLELIDPNALSVQAMINVGGKEAESVALEAENGVLSLRVDRPANGEKVIVNFAVMAKTVRGAPISPKIKPVMIDDRFIQELIEQEGGNEADEESEKQDGALESSEPAEDNDTSESEEGQQDSDEEGGEEDQNDVAEEKEGSWGMVIGSVVVVNLLLIAGGFFGYRWWKKRSADKHEQLLERMK